VESNAMVFDDSSKASCFDGLDAARNRSVYLDPPQNKSFILCVNEILCGSVQGVAEDRIELTADASVRPCFASTRQE
jgi:hypothetical protein